MGTNAVLTGEGAHVLFIGTEGHEEIPWLGRGSREELFALQPTKTSPLVAAQACIGVPLRGPVRGTDEQTPAVSLSVAQRNALLERVAAHAPDAVAIVLLHAPQAPALEASLAAMLQGFVDTVSCSSALSAEGDEVARAMTTWLDAFVAPVVGDYVARLVVPQHSSLTLVRSDGGRMSAQAAAAAPCRTLLSGPAGGAAAAGALAEALGLSRAVSFDMGGTSTDVAWIEAGQARVEAALHVGPYRAGVSSVAVRTVGAGGGSVVGMDAGGALQVGPASAGAEPGPAAYGNGGPFTLTDAWLLLGRVPSVLACGLRALDVEASRAAAQHAAGASEQVPAAISPRTMAQGAIHVAAGATAHAVRRATAQRGIDPAGATLIAFGGAGPLLAAEAAEALDIRHVVVPHAPGTFAAWGTLLAPLRAEAEAPAPGLVDALACEAVFASLATRVRACLMRDGAQEAVLACSVEVRYAGQEEGIDLPWSATWAEAFAKAHEREFGFTLPERDIELVRLRVRGHDRGGAHADVLQSPDPPFAACADTDGVATGKALRGVYHRHAVREGCVLPGPCRIEEATATTWVPSGWIAHFDEHGLLHMLRDDGGTV